MRRPMRTVLAFSIALQVIAATPAHGWWEYIEGLSGPKLHGPHLEWPLVCYMERRSPDDAALLRKYTPRPPGQDPPAFDIDSGAVGAKLPCAYKIHNRQGRRRLWSFDLGARWHWDNSFKPADGHKVNFITLAPTLTWHPHLLPTQDVFDISGGVGWYRFISNAFRDSPTADRHFDGIFYDMRVDVHVPTVIRRIGRWTVFIPTGRFGMLYFPAGFDQDVFADTQHGFRSKDMHGFLEEKAFYFGFFFDLDALAR